MSDAIFYQGPNTTTDPDLKPTVSPTWYPGALVGKIANSVPFQPNLPTWIIPFVGAGVLLWLASTHFYHAVLYGTIGLIAYWLMTHP
jgi:hypothetical protein